MMTNRELFHCIMNYDKPDRTPFYLVEGMSQQTERKWYAEEELPLHANGLSVVDYDYKVFDMNMNDQPPLPAYFPRQTFSCERYGNRIDIYGNTFQTINGYHLSPSTGVYVDYPLKTMEDWLKYKKLFDPYDKRRFPIYWGEELFEHYNRTGDPVILNMTWGPARGIKTYYQFGFERFMDIVMYEMEILEDMFDFWADFTISYIEQFVNKFQIDAFFLNDDGIAYKNSTMISPNIYKRLYKPYVRKVIDYLRSREISIIGYYTSGNLCPLIPELLNAGFNLIGPIESSSGMDAVKLRKEYDKDLRLIGNLSRDAVLEGKEAIYRDVMSKVPYLMESGGYIPALDDIITPDMKMENVKYLVQLVKSIPV